MNIRKFLNKTPQIADNAFVDSTAVIIGDVILGEESSVWPMCVLRGDINKIIIGKRSNIQDGTIIHVNHPGKFNPDGDAVIIGDEVIIGHQVMLHGCTIANNVLIGIGARVLDGVKIETDVMVGAGSLVPPNKTLMSGFLYVGSPARQVRPLTDEEKAFLRYNANHYVELQKQYRKSN